MVMVNDTAYRRANRPRKMKGRKITQVRRPLRSGSGGANKLRRRRAVAPTSTDQMMGHA
jgi:hypothetical protein